MPPACFNPLPVIKPGVTTRRCSRSQLGFVSIHSRLLSRELHRTAHHSCQRYAVSIHSRLLSRELHQARKGIYLGALFQSTPGY
ncbi:protein of unknown function [Methylocaldum szegediense]|uniref:Uncharacterized protein n=1 Tax=Methylocaldum szegediense TaxID=73780 RepID=A0ABM9I943_9GAMM|nr:protein of unknown function [Methylocaldum szegediense]